MEAQKKLLLKKDMMVKWPFEQKNNNNNNNNNLNFQSQNQVQVEFNNNK